MGPLSRRQLEIRMTPAPAVAMIRRDGIFTTNGFTCPEAAASVPFEMQHILIVEDEQDIADLIGFNLQRAGYKVFKAYDGVEGTEAAKRVRPDLILLDLMLPKRDGFAVFRELQRDSRTVNTPVIMLTARSQSQDRIQGLGAGADDYLTKPFSPKELILRVQAVLKRSTAAPGPVDLIQGPFRFDRNMLKFHLADEPVDLTSTEFKLLLFLCDRFGKVQDRNDLHHFVWGYSDATYSRTLDTHVKRLRQKLGQYGSWLENVRGVGYRVIQPAG